MYYYFILLNIYIILYYYIEYMQISLLCKYYYLYIIFLFLSYYFIILVLESLNLSKNRFHNFYFMIIIENIKMFF